jgi:hypothetical protein
MDKQSKTNIKSVTVILIVMGLLVVGSLMVNLNNPQEVVTEKVCYPAVYSVSNNEVVQVKESYCEVVDR